MDLGGEQGAAYLTFTADRRGTGCSSFTNNLTGLLVAESVAPREGCKEKMNRDLFSRSLKPVPFKLSQTAVGEEGENRVSLCKRTRERRKDM